MKNLHLYALLLQMVLICVLLVVWAYIGFVEFGIITGIIGAVFTVIGMGLTWFVCYETFCFLKLERQIEKENNE